MLKKLLLTGLIAYAFPGVFGQNRTCHTMENHARLCEEDPTLLDRRNDIESFTAYAIENELSDDDRTVVNIPVVVHVVYNNSTQNISDAQILSQIDVLNKDFRKLNADWTNTPSLYTGLVADCEINFCLANRDPNGASTTGIIRTSTTSTSFIDNDAVKYTAQGGHDAWPSGQYLNLWICNLGGGLLGYTQFPGGPTATDGVVINYTAFGTMGTATAPYNKGRTATHEVGHWLNLMHIWGDDGTSCTGSDMVTDTPNQADENYGCPTYPTASCSNSCDMYMNYMDYTNDACMNMFSTGQKARMQSLFVSGGARASLVSSPGCSGTSTPVYCNASGSNTQYEWISKVTFNSINNITAANGGYGNFTSFSTTVNKGTAYPMTLTPGFASTTYPEFFKVYIDYNNDKDFVDAGELVYTSAGTTVMVTTSITIPATAVTGSTRMRVMMKDGSITSPCEAYTYGEVEDYTLNIQSSSTCGQPASLTSTSITSSSATLSWTAITGATNYTVGRKLSTATTYTYVTVTSNTYSATGLTSGSTYNWQVKANCTSGSSSYTNASFTTTSVCSDVYESNETQAAAKLIPINTNNTAKIGTSTDVDWFKFSNTSTSPNIKIQLTNLPFDYDLKMYNASGTLLYTSENGGTTAETIIYNAAPVGTYYIKVFGYSGAFSSGSCYTIRANVGSTNYKLAEGTEEILEEEILSTISVYPNPSADGNVSVQFTNKFTGAFDVVVLDATGNILINTQMEKVEDLIKFNLNLSEMANGIYFVMIRSEDYEFSEKIMVNK